MKEKKQKIPATNPLIWKSASLYSSSLSLPLYLLILKKKIIVTHKKKKQNRIMQTLSFDFQKKTIRKHTK